MCEALDSVFKQTFRPIQLIIIDDGSTDDSIQAIKTWIDKIRSEEFFAVKLISKPNGGVSSARNRGVKEVEGDYIQFLDSDDILHSTRCQKLADIFLATGADMIMTGFEGFDSKSGEIIEKRPGHPGADLVVKALQGNLWGNTLRTAFTRELVTRLGPWREDMVCFEDREYVERAVLAAKKPLSVGDILASARREGSDRLSNKFLTHEGRRCRIIAEEALCDFLLGNGNSISLENKSQFASRLYRLGCRSNASGWSDLGKRCAEIADRIEAPRPAYARVKRLWCKMGIVGGKCHQTITIIRESICRLKTASFWS